MAAGLGGRGGHGGHDRRGGRCAGRLVRRFLRRPGGLVHLALPRRLPVNPIYRPRACPGRRAGSKPADHHYRTGRDGLGQLCPRGSRRNVDRKGARVHHRCPCRGGFEAGALRSSTSSPTRSPRSSCWPLSTSPATILAESSLSYLGLGVQPPTVTWGLMVADGREYLATAWWLAVFPGLAISYTVLGVIFLGDWLRDALDPKLRGR